MAIFGSWVVSRGLVLGELWELKLRREQLEPGLQVLSYGGAAGWLVGFQATEDAPSIHGLNGPKVLSGCSKPQC